MILSLSIVLAISLLVNILLVWYIKKMLKEFFLTSGNVEQIDDSMNEFLNHLEAIHELEMFYGDSTLEGLISHSKQLANEIKDFKNIYSLELEQNVDDDEYETSEEEN